MPKLLRLTFYRAKLAEMAKNKIKVFLFSQQPLFREGMATSLTSVEDIQIIGKAGVTDKVLLTIEVQPPDVAILDLDTTIDSGLNLAKRLKQLLPSIAIITLAASPNDDQLFQALSSQVAAYLDKGVTGDHLAKTIRRVASGNYPIDEDLSKRPEVAGKILEQFKSVTAEQETEALVAPLTHREIEILNYVAQGFANKQIAAEVNISEQTIKNHVTSIMAKLNANARTQAVVIAVKKGLISLS